MELIRRAVIGYLRRMVDRAWTGIMLGVLVTLVLPAGSREADVARVMGVDPDSVQVEP